MLGAIRRVRARPRRDGPLRQRGSLAIHSPARIACGPSPERCMPPRGADGIETWHVSRRGGRRRVVGRRAVPERDAGRTGRPSGTGPPSPRVAAIDTFAWAPAWGSRRRGASGLALVRSGPRLRTSRAPGTHARRQERLCGSPGTCPGPPRGSVESAGCVPPGGQTCRRLPCRGSRPYALRRPERLPVLGRCSAWKNAGRAANAGKRRSTLLVALRRRATM